MMGLVGWFAVGCLKGVGSREERRDLVMVGGGEGSFTFRIRWTLLDRAFSISVSARLEKIMPT